MKIRFSVIPAEAGIQCFRIVINYLDSGFPRSDDFLRNHQKCKVKNENCKGKHISF
jgi:hypothetical protein